MGDIVSIEYHHMFDTSLPVDALIAEHDSNPEVQGYNKSIIYCIPLLKHVDLHAMDKDAIHRMICRCIEHSLNTS